MDCYQIEWQGLFSFDEARRDAAAREMGVYVAYECKGESIKKMRYIGRSKELRQRVGTYQQTLVHFLDEKEMRKYRFALGTILSLEGHIPSENIDAKQLSDVESFLINHYQPSGNHLSTKKGYKSTPLLVISTGYLGKMQKLIAYYKHLVPLLTGKSIAAQPTKTTKPKKPRDWGDESIFS